MRRKRLSRSSSHLLEKIENLHSTPLYQLSDLLKDLVVGAQMQGDPAGEQKINTYVQNILDRLPHRLDDRFLFDAYLIQSTLNSWSQGEIRLSNMVIPTYSIDWGHEPPILIQSVRNSQIHRFDIIRIRSNEQEGNPDLIDYPWLFHELGHLLISKHGQTILDRFLPKFNTLISRLKIRSIADTGSAKIKADMITEEISARWIPSSINDPAWLRELVVDVIALWSLGPAYIEAFESEHTNVSDPFLIEQGHPPVELRTRALVETANKLGWKNETQKLKASIKLWRDDLPQLIRNRYISLSQIGLINAAINVTTDFCTTAKIPRLDTPQMERIIGLINDNIVPEESVEIIFGAFLVYEKDETIYENWEANIYQTLVNEIKP